MWSRVFLTSLVQLVDPADGMGIFGHFHAHKELNFFYRSSEDVEFAAFAHEAPPFTGIELDNMPVEWVRRIVSEKRLEEFLIALQLEFDKSIKETHDLLESLNRLGARPTADLSAAISNAEKKISFPEVIVLWRKALVHVHTNPAGAITHAYSLLETVCKHILHDMGVQPPSDQTLLTLFKAVTKNLALGSDNQANEHLTVLCRGLACVPQGLAPIRNSFSESHGKGPSAGSLTIAHARLAVDASGMLSAFLMERYAAQKKQEKNGK